MRLILMRHSICEGIKERIINGWDDYNLTQEGRVECVLVAQTLKDKLKENNIDLVYASYLSRTIETASIILREISNTTKIEKDIRLNERHYGVFQGKSRDEARKNPKYKSISISTEGIDVRPPEISDKEYTKLLESYMVKLGQSKEELEKVIPHSESVLDVEKRVISFLRDKIFAPENKDKTIFVVTHSNIFKMIVKQVEKLTYEEVVSLRISTCGTKIYDFDLVGDKYKLQSTFNHNKEYNE